MDRKVSLTLTLASEWLDLLQKEATRSGLRIEDVMREAAEHYAKDHLDPTREWRLTDRGQGEMLLERKDGTKTHYVRRNNGAETSVLVGCVVCSEEFTPKYGTLYSLLGNHVCELCTTLLLLRR